MQTNKKNITNINKKLDIASPNVSHIVSRIAIEHVKNSVTSFTITVT